MHGYEHDLDHAEQLLSDFILESDDDRILIEQTGEYNGYTYPPIITFVIFRRSSVRTWYGNVECESVQDVAFLRSLSTGTLKYIARTQARNAENNYSKESCIAFLSQITDRLYVKIREITNLSEGQFYEALVQVLGSSLLEERLEKEAKIIVDRDEEKRKNEEMMKKESEKKRFLSEIEEHETKIDDIRKKIKSLE